MAVMNGSVARGYGTLPTHPGFPGVLHIEKTASAPTRPIERRQK